MDEVGSTDVFMFEGFRFDRAGDYLFRVNGPRGAEPIALGSRALALLGLLLDRQGQLVTKDEIFGVVWSGMAIEEANLTVQISALRRILDQDRERGSCIQTILGRGYRFVAAVTRVAAEDRSNSTSLSEGSSRARPRMSIVVLPFTNLSDDREQQYFADGITDDLTTDLSRIVGMVVISRSTAFTYRDKSVGARQVGRELGVSYVLEGSVRRSGSWVRLNAQLIDVDTDVHLWAERFECNTAELFALQNEITSQVALSLSREVIRAEAVRPAQHPGALDYILRGRAVMLKPSSRDSYAKGIELFERALALDPCSVEAQSRLASTLVGRVLDRLTDAPAADIGYAQELTRQALEASPRSPLAHYAKGQVLRAQLRPEEAIPEYEVAIAFNRNWVHAIGFLGWCNLYSGWVEEAILLLEQAIHVSPRDIYVALWHNWIGQAYLLRSRVNEAIEWFEKARRANAGSPNVHAALASAYALNGDTERAALELAEARKLSSRDRFSSIARLSALGYFGLRQTRALFEATYFEGLRKAGMPEE
jgi:TolB-like protein/Flp pilus assembly protein TadD